MSGHLIGCAGDVTNLGRSQKLALVAFADSADDRTHIGFAGYVGVQRWANVSRSRAAELIDDLVNAGYLQRHRTARPGRRAEYVVFPHGCCELHRPAVDESEVDDASVAAVIAWARSAGVELQPWQAVAMAATNGSEIPDSNGSEISDPSGGDVSEKSDPSTQDPTDESEIPDSNSSNRSTNGSDSLDPFTDTPTEDTPLPPSGRRAHGTSPRQVAAKAHDHAITKQRAADRQALEQSRRDRAAAAAANDSEAVAAAKAHARQAVTASRGR